MDQTVFFAVLAAAFFHAGWNFLVKSSPDKYLGMTAIALGHVPPAMICLVFVPLPAWSSWPYVVASAILHAGYQLFLGWSYKHGDISQVYPIARGTAPILVTLVSTLLLGEVLTRWQLLAVVIIAFGIMSLIIVRGRDGLRNPVAAALALVTSLFIAGYTLIDGLGARVGGSPVGFYAVATILNAVVFLALTPRRAPDALRRLWPEAWRVFLFGGAASFLAYAIAVWAFARAPIPLVAALRETSIIFALILGVVVMKERLDLGKVVATFFTLTGAALLRLAR